MVGRFALLVLVAVLLIELPQPVNLAGSLTPLLGLSGFQVASLSLPWWANVTVLLLGGAAGLERNFSMKYHPLLDE